MRTPSSPDGRRRRVPAMAPEERRAALIAATVPLLREHGLAVSTRQIADAAGVAEGTIFNVFPDKASLLRAAVISAFDPGPLVTAIAEIELTADLRDRLRVLVDLLRGRLAANGPIIAATRSVAAEPDERGELFERLREARGRILAAVEAVIGPDRARLRRDPAGAARLLLLLTMATVHGGGFADPSSLTSLDSTELVTLLLDGLLLPPAIATPTGDPG